MAADMPNAYVPHAIGEVARDVKLENFGGKFSHAHLPQTLEALVDLGSPPHAGLVRRQQGRVLGIEGLHQGLEIARVVNADKRL